MEKEVKIIKKHIPDVEEQLAQQIADHVSKMRNLKLDKSPGIAETIDWAKGVLALQEDKNALMNSLSCILKSDRDIKLVSQEIFNQ